MNLYAYAGNNPVAFSDPLGLDAIKIKYKAYPVRIPGTDKRLPLGHGAVIAVNEKTGFTQYYEYGRYDEAGFGAVRRRPVPNLEMGEDGKPTQASLDHLYKFISEQYGHGTEVEATYDSDADYTKVVGFTRDRMKDPERKAYNLLTNNCFDFVSDAIAAGKK